MVQIFKIFTRKQPFEAPAVQGSSSTASTTSHPVGCETLFEGVAPIVADIIFVHGLRGHRRKTWTKDDVCWPEELLSKESALSHTRVLTFGYDANVVKLMGRASLNTLFDHSLNLLNELSRERRQDARDRPIIFVAHSLGGLLVKDALDHSDRVRGTKPHLARILPATRGVIFLGTPHRGSGMTSLAKVVASIARVALHSANEHLIQDLERDSQVLDRIRDNFSRILDKRTLAIWSFVEELAMTGVGKVVSGDSAIIGDARENRESICADHIGMAKFSTRGDTGYKKILYAIEMLLEGPLEDERYTANQDDSEALPHQEVMTLYDIPTLQVPHFVARNALLTRLDELFERSTTTPSRLIVVLLGMGGAGKSQLALEYCRRMRDSGNFKAIFWLDVSSRNALYSAMVTIAKRLLPTRVLDNPHAAVTLVKEVLSRWSDSWLMVFDNLDNPPDLHDIMNFFPDGRYGSILVTSRHAGSKELGQFIELDCMVEEEGLQLLLGSLEADTKELAFAQQILMQLGYLPLAIDQARAHISRRALSLRQFVDKWGERKRIIMQDTPHIWLYRRMVPDTEGEISLSLLTTWELSLPLLGVGEEHAAKLRDVLTLFAFFYPVSIGENLFSGDANVTMSPMSIFYNDGHWNHSEFEDAIVQMQEMSLVRFSYRNDEIVVSLHSMVSEWLRIRLDEDSQSKFLATAISHLQNYLESTTHDDHIISQEALLHTDTICRNAEFQSKSNSFVEACFTFGVFYGKYGRYEDSLKMYKRALVGYEKAWGPNHTSTFDTVNNLGALYAAQGHVEDAERMYDQALAGKEKAWGPNHTSTLDTVNNLGNLYVNQGRLEDAERMYDRALAGYENAWGPNDTSTLDIVNNLGNLYKNRGRLEDAERMYDRALAGYEKACGPNHTSTLDIVNNFGNLYKVQGCLEDAERMYDRALTGYEKAWGPNHTSTLDTVNNLGLLYIGRGRLEDAERMYDRALAGYEKACGPNHTSTLDTVNNLGNLYKVQGRLEDAERMYDRALTGYEKAWGPNHTSTLDTVNNLGLLYVGQGRLEDAGRMYYRVLAGYEKAWGLNHTSTLGTVNNLGSLYKDQGRLEDAERMYDRALAGYEKACGPNHTSTLDTVNNFGALYVDQGRLEDAERMYYRALAGKEKACGPNHTSTLDTVNNLGNLYKVQGRLEDAERMYDRALAGKEKGWGPNHTSTLDTVNNLGLLYVDQGRLKDAERMCNRALTGYEKILGPNHTSTLNTVHNLAALCVDQGHLEDAERMYDRALAGFEKARGPDHTSKLATVNNLGLLYVDQGRLEDAERMYHRALAGYEKALGPNHTSTLATVNNLGLLYVDQGRLEDAERMYDQALAGKEKAWGPNHTSTLETVNNLGVLYKHQGHLKDAERMYDRALAGKEKAWGPNHTSTLETVNNLGNLYKDQHRLEDAERMYNRALVGFERAWGPNHKSTLRTVNNLGNLFRDQGLLEDAERMYKRALGS